MSSYRTPIIPDIQYYCTNAKLPHGRRPVGFTVLTVVASGFYIFLPTLFPDLFGPGTRISKVSVPGGRRDSTGA
uniref:Uncharacterized protein n=1 Tax=Trichuris muris TaxID=70415 RepID=A0A5S6Q1R6_TRIMR